MIFTVEKGCFSYEKSAEREQYILKDIELSAKSGQLIAILGPNGAGKTTLLRCMMGFLKWNEGKSAIDGRDIRSIGTRELWQRVAYVPQARGLASAYTVEDMVLLGRSSHFGMFGQPGAEDRRIARETLDGLGLSAIAGRSCSAISGGELQMVLIARAMASRPELLILDEPESNLDFKNQLIILDTLHRLADSGVLCIFNTHYPVHGLRHADLALLLDKRGGFAYGTAREVITEDNLAEAFGVQTVIGEIETKHNTYYDVLPLRVIPREKREERPITAERKDDMETRIAIISIIIEDREAAESINSLLHEYGKYVVGRMGMPYEKKQLSIMSIILDAPEQAISTLSGKLGMLAGVSVKTTYSKR